MLGDKSEMRGGFMHKIMARYLKGKKKILESFSRGGM